MSYPGLYVHVPFCRSRCAYCAFCSTTRGGEADRWLAALDREAGSWAGRWAPFDTLYIGGGTPSSLAPGELERLFLILGEHFTFTPDREMTLEANPADLDRDTAGLLAASGVNRVSLGGQSFDDGVLAFLGRRHRAGDIGRSVELLRDAGIGRYSIDLISAVPGQPLENWVESLCRAVELAPEHLSCYQLSIEEGTPLGRRAALGEVKPLDEEEAREQFIVGSEYLVSRGYRHYEVSNHARSEKTRSRHNMKYWTHVSYLGLGPSAHSFDGAHRWWNDDTLDGYCGRLESGGPSMAGEERLSPEQLEMERIALGLRLADGFEAGPLGDASESVARLEHFQSIGLLTMAGGRIKPSREGLLMADALARELCLP